MTDAYLLLLVMLGIINIRQSNTQLLTDLNNNNLINDFLNNFPEATVEQDDEIGQNIMNIANLEYFLFVNGFIITTLVPDFYPKVLIYRIEIAGKSFIGGSMEITVRSNGQAVSFANRFGSDNKTILTGRFSSSGIGIGSMASNERVALGAMNLLATVRPGLNGFTLDDFRLQFVSADTDLPSNITESDRALGGRIKNWLSNKLPVVVNKYQDYIDMLTNSGALILNDSLL